MQAMFIRLDSGEVIVATPTGSEADPRAIELDTRVADTGLDWTVRNTGREPVAVRAVGWRVPVEATGPVRMFANGYQSWSPTGLVVLGRDVDPSLSDNSIDIARGCYHADQDVVAPGELRSELVTVLADTAGSVLVGFTGGDRHDGTFRLSKTEDGVQLVCEAFLGDAVLAPGEERRLHGVAVRSDATPAEMLDRWAAEVGQLNRARVAAPYQVGWCSWYHYFHEVTEADFLGNLERAADWPFEVFQLDDGFQAAIGDWLSTTASFPNGLEAPAAAVRAAGLRPGIWLAPFLVAPSSEIARYHPEWIARDPAGEQPLIGMYNDHWGGFVHVLDTSNPAVLEHLERLAADLVDAGFTYLKLDFTYAPSIDGTYLDPSRTPAERVRAGYDAIRRGAGEDTFVLGCGCPLGPAIGVVDGMRIGPDVAPNWALSPDQLYVPGYAEAAPATLNAWRSTLARSFMHRRLWLNDPDCIMLRTDQTELVPAAARAWAHAVAVSGGMALVSDDLSLLGDAARLVLEEVVETGRQVDASARTGPAPACPDLLDRRTPERLRGDGYELVGVVDSTVSGTASGATLRPYQL
ncbi:MAG: hypothetical protein JJLCMIEE_03349 [Acidimicrobiales bacterium]|nr:hypothetical protein [Acidimicrobiales bacterium]